MPFYQNSRFHWVHGPDLSRFERLANAANLRNWDSTFPLLWQRADRRPAWQGYVSEFYIDRAISEEEVGRAFSDKSFFCSIGDSLVADYR